MLNQILIFLDPPFDKIKTKYSPKFMNLIGNISSMAVLIPLRFYRTFVIVIPLYHIFLDIFAQYTNNEKMTSGDFQVENQPIVPN